MTDHVREKDCMNISYGLVGQDKEFRDFTKWIRKSLEGFALEREII